MHKILVLVKPVEIRGVVDFPLWDFIPVSNYIYPVLHGEIGSVNNALDAFIDIIDDNIKVLTDEEKTFRNTTIFADAAWETAADELKHFKDERSLVDIRFYEVLKSDIKDRLKEEITQDEKTELLHEMQEIQQAVLDIKAQ